MKKTLIGLILCFVMGITQVTYADTSSTGATTNTQTTTSGSNTTISGGYSQDLQHTHMNNSSRMYVGGCYSTTA